MNNATNDLSTGFIWGVVFVLLALLGGLGFIVSNSKFPIEKSYMLRSLNSETETKEPFTYGIGGSELTAYYSIYVNDVADTYTLTKYPVKSTSIRLGCEKPIVTEQQTRWTGGTINAELCLPSNAVRVKYDLYGSEE